MHSAPTRRVHEPARASCSPAAGLTSPAASRKPRRIVGRKNHYGSKSRRGTEVASRLYTILETCKLHDVDPAAYLHAAVIAADRGDALLPWHFIAKS